MNKYFAITVTIAKTKSKNQRRKNKEQKILHELYYGTAAHLFQTIVPFFVNYVILFRVNYSFIGMNLNEFSVLMFIKHYKYISVNQSQYYYFTVNCLHLY